MGIRITQRSTGIYGDSVDGKTVVPERRSALQLPAPELFPVMTPEERTATEQSLRATRAQRAGNEAERLSLPGAGSPAASPTAWMTTDPADTRRYWQLAQENQVLDQRAAEQSTRLNLSEIGSWKQERGKQYAGIRENPDYAAMSQPDEKKTIRGLTPARTTGNLSIYNYVNDLDGYKDRMQNGPDRGEPLRKYDFLTAKERADYNYVTANQGLDAGKAYLEYLDYDLNARMTQAAEQEARIRASESPVGASALSVAQNLAAGAGIVSGVVQGVQKAFTGRPVDYNTAAFLPSRLSTATREQVATDIEKKHPNATAAGVNMLSFLYQTGMSMADSGAIAALTILGVPGATALLGGSAATSAALDVKERGGSDFQALSYGLAAGFAESLFENVSLEKLIHPKTADGLRGVLMNIARQAFTEGSEEFTTTLANTLTDAIINGDKSELLAKQRQLVQSGMSEEEAREQAWKDWAISLAADFLGGAISGGIMGGGASTVNFMAETNLRKTGQAMRSLGVTNADVQDAILTAMNGARDAQSRAWLSDMADRAARGEDLAGKLPLADLGRVFALRADIGPNRISETAYRKAARNASKPYLEDGRAAETPALTLPTAQEVATAPPAAQEAFAAQEREMTAPAAEAAQRATEGLTGETGGVYTEERAGLRLPTVETGEQTEMEAPGLTLTTAENTRARDLREELAAELTPLLTGTQEDMEIAMRALYARSEVTDALQGAGLLTQEDIDKKTPGAMLRAAVNFAKGAVNNGQGQEAGRRAAAADVGGQQGAGAAEIRSREPGRSRTGGGSQRQNRVGSGGQGFSQRVEQIRQGWQRQEGAGRLRAAVEALGAGERVSTAALGIGGGTDRATAALLPERMDAKTEKELALFREAQRSFAQRGISVKGFTGTLEVEDADGSVFRARGAVSEDGKTIWVRLDHPDLSWQQILAHEDFHERVKNDKQLLRDAAAAFDRDFTEAERRAIIDDYCDTYGYFNVSEDYVLEEVLADYYAGIDIYAGTENAQKDVEARGRNVRETVGSRGEAQSEEAGGETRASRETGKKIRLPVYSETELRDNALALQTMRPVSQLTGKEFPKGGLDLKTQVLTFFESLGNAIYTDTFGNVDLTKNSWRSEQRHGLTNEKAISFAAIPDVLDNGVVIDVYEPKPNTYERVVVAAPIMIGTEKYYMGVMLQRDNRNQRLYLHDVVTEKQGTRNHTQTGPYAGNSNQVSRSSSRLDISRILLNALDVKPESEVKTSRETDAPYNRTALLTEDTVDRWLKDYASKSSPKYAQAYITRMSPDQFLKLTTSRTGRLAVSSQTGPMDAEKLIEATRQQPLQLRISGGEVVGHEGRHRATALSRADVRSIPVLVFDSSNKYSKTDVPEMVLQGQDFGSSRSYDRVTLENLTPLSYENREKIIRDYGAQDAFERSAEKLGYRQTMRFSMEKPVEETRDLIAVHNLTERNLIDIGALGGAPAPSIAIVKAKAGHSKYGPISLVYGKDTIDPRKNSKNKVYGSDAWTPTAPKMGYQLDEKMAKAIRSRVEDILGDEAGVIRLHLDDDNLSDQLNRNYGSFSDAYKNDTEMRYVFLKDTGRIKYAPTKEKTYSDLVSNKALRKLADQYDVRDLFSKSVDDLMEYEPELRRWVKAAYIEKQTAKGADPETVQKIANALYEKPLTFSKMNDLLYAAVKMQYEGNVNTVDSSALYDMTKEAFKDKGIEAAYERWLDELSNGIIAKKGIRNQKELYTPSGNRRSFDALYDPYTLENIVNAMSKEQQRGAETFGITAGSLQSVTTPAYRNIAEIKADSGRLGAMDEEEYRKLKEDLDNRISDAVETVYKNTKHFNDNRFMEYDSIAEALINAARGDRSKDNIMRSMRRDGYTINDSVAEELESLYAAAALLPTEYFEAKPMRAVGFDEIVAAIVPDDISDKARKVLTDNGVNTVEYESGNDGDRIAKLNGLEGVKFSRDIPGETEELRAENEALKDRLAYWQSQVKPSDRTQPREEDARRVARDILKSYESAADRETVTAALRELAHTVMSEDVRWTDVRDQATRLAGTIIENARTLAGGDEAKLHREIRAAIREKKVSFSGQADIPDYNLWRRANFGKLTIAKDGIPVETRWQELQDAYGEGYFPADIQNPTDQVLYLAELWDRLRDVYENPYSADLAEATQYLANELIDRVLGEEIRQAPTTYADRAETRIAREALKGELRVQKVKALLDAERERRRNQVANLKEHYKAKEAKSRESRKAQELRTKITKHARKMTEELLHPTDKRHIPESLRRGVAAVLSAIDLGSGYSIVYDRDGNYKRVERGLELGAEETRRTQAFLAMKKALQSEADGLVLDPALLGTMEEPGSLERLVTELADKPIANMNSEELQVVYDALRGVEAAVRSANRMLSNARWGAVSEAADALRSDNAGKTAPLELAGYPGRVQGLTRLDMLTPEGYFHRLGRAGQAIFKMLRGAQDAFITNMADATEDTRKIIGDMNTGALEREQHKVTMGGEEVTMTTAQIMELYCLMQRDQGMQHIMTGGILIEPVRKGVKKTTQTEPLHPSLGELADAVKLLTADEIRVADALQQYLSVDMAELGNEATLAVYGYKKFGQEEKYWKIRSNRNELQQSIEKETQTTSVANRGFTKAVNPRADTSVKIGSIFDTYSQSINDMATYAAWLAVGEDVNRIRNYVWRDADGQRAGTVKGILDRVHGTGGANYLQRLLADIANGAGTDDTGLTSGFVGAYKAAAIGANIRVIIQQPTAILRALEMIDPKYMAGLRNPMKAFDRAKKYSPIAQWKDWGYFDINTGRKMKDVLFENPSKLEKLRQVSMALAGKADSFAWGILWGAVEAETKATTDLTPGTEAFYHACAERFNDIIDHTQVVDGILQRSQIMQSKDTITRMAVSFMSEPTKQYNQFMSAVYDLRHSKNRADRDAAKRHMARTVFSMLAAGLANVLAQSIVDALRDDDREKTYWEKLLQKFLGYDPKDDTFGKRWQTFWRSNMGELIHPASYLPYVKDIMSIMQGYSVERMDMEGISDTITAMTRAYKALNGDGKQTVAYALVKLAEQAAKLLGLPLYNVDRDLTSLYTTIINSADMPVLQYGLERYKNKPLESGNLSAALNGILWDARQKGDGSYDIIVRKMLKDGYSQEIIDKAMLGKLAEESGYTAAVKAADAAGNANKSYDLREKLTALQSLTIPEDERDQIMEDKLSEKQYENFHALMDAGMSFAEVTLSYMKYAELDAEDLTTSEKANTFALWVDKQPYTDEQKRAVKERLTYWQSMPLEAGRYEKFTGAGLSPDEAYELNQDIGALDPLPGKSSVSDAQRYDVILASDLSEKQKLAAIGTVMGTDLKTESGNPTQWAKVNAAVDAGLKLDSVMGMVREDTLDYFTKYRDAGLGANDSMNLAKAIKALKPEAGKSQVSDIQKWQAAIRTVSGQFNQDKALRALMDDSAEAKYDAAYSAGINPDVYVKYKADTKDFSSEYDANGKEINGQTKKDKFMSYIDGLNLTNPQKDALYFASGYSESTLEKDAPWHSGGGRGGSGLYNRATTPTLRLPTIEDFEDQPVRGLRLPTA